MYYITVSNRIKITAKTLKLLKIWAKTVKLTADNLFAKMISA